MASPMFLLKNIIVLSQYNEEGIPLCSPEFTAKAFNGSTDPFHRTSQKSSHFNIRHWMHWLIQKQIINSRHNKSESNCYCRLAARITCNYNFTGLFIGLLVIGKRNVCWQKLRIFKCGFWKEEKIIQSFFIWIIQLPKKDV